MTSPYRILVVDDEEDLCEILKVNLELSGYEVTTALSAEEALKLDLRCYDLLILDVMMGELSGFDMARRIRSDARYEQIPIMFLTAKDTEADLLTAFDSGADEFMTKPFSIREVTARVMALLRRTSTRNNAPLPTTIIFKTLLLDTQHKRLQVDGIEIPVTKKEFAILRLLMSHMGHLFSREEILARAWDDKVYVLDRTVDVNITRLRKKLGAYGAYIITRSGYGYCFDPDNKLQ